MHAAVARKDSGVWASTYSRPRLVISLTRATDHGARIEDKEAERPRPLPVLAICLVRYVVGSEPELRLPLPFGFQELAQLTSLCLARESRTAPRPALAGALVCDRYSHIGQLRLQGLGKPLSS